jgi:hypothetical protein
MKRILLTTSVPDERTAWTKARGDVSEILRQEGYSTMRVPALNKPGELVSFVAALARQTASGGHILIEYPFDQRKRAYLLYLFRLLAPVKIYALVHDINSLRFDTAPNRDLAVLNLFDGVISANPSMSRWLREQGFRKKIVNQYLWDYLNQGFPPAHENSLSSPVQLLYAGNLSKSQFIYHEDVGRLKNIQLSVFGDFFEPGKLKSPVVVHKGAFDPNHPVLDRRFHFGLVWDGTSVDTCDGQYGRYLKYNNSHKVSLYISLGLPIVIWKGAAMAAFVADQQMGVTIDNLAEIEELPNKLSNERYLAMARTVETLSLKVRSGNFLKSAVGQLATA